MKDSWQKEMAKWKNWWLKYRDMGEKNAWWQEGRIIDEKDGLHAKSRS